MVNKDTQKEFVPEACFSLIAFFKRGFIRGVVASSIMQRDNASKSLFYYFYFYFYFNLRQDYSNLLCMK
jgi:hypothetical protein